jgi:hypothetical protein
VPNKPTRPHPSEPGAAPENYFIVSEGGIEFMRPWTEKVYGIPVLKVGDQL